MTIEIALLISIISVTFGVFGVVSAYRRNNRNDRREETAQMTSVLIKLENINNGIIEVKSDMNSIEKDVKDHTERLIRVEASVKQAHKRLDDLKVFQGKGKSK